MITDAGRWRLFKVKFYVFQEKHLLINGTNRNWIEVNGCRLPDNAHPVKNYSFLFENIYNRWG